MESRRAFTLIELLVVIGIIALLSALLLPAIGVVIRNRDQAVTMQLVRSVSLSLETYRGDQGFYPEPADDNQFERDYDDPDNLLVQLNERYDLVLDNRFMKDQVFCDVWDTPIHYVKGNFEDRHPRGTQLEEASSQDTNRPDRDSAFTDFPRPDEPPSETDWNRSNRGGFPYVWSYGPAGPMSDPDTWVYLRND